MTSPILAAARRYHELGFNLVPTAEDKRPAVDPMGAGRLAWDRWQTERQTTEDFARLPWDNAAGAAAVCGPVSQSLVCLDFDGGTDPAPVRAALATLGVAADYPWTVQTPSGAYHVWVSCPGLELDGNTGRLDRPGRLGFAHVEVRWTGHYAILPPSNRGAYRFLGEIPTEGPAVVTPAALLAAFALVTQEKTPPARVAAAPVTDAARVATPGETSAYAQAALRNELSALAGAHEGTRNDQLNRSAFALGQLVEAGALSRTDVENALIDVALALGLGETETRATIRSGFAAGAKAPRTVPPPHAYRNGSRPPAENTDAADTLSIARFRLTDLGNAERLVHHAGDDLRYCHEWARWLVWTGQRWEHDRAGLVIRHGKHTVRRIYEEAADVQDEEARKAIAKWALRSEARQRIDAMVGLAQSEHNVTVLSAALDADPWLLNVANGALDLRTGRLNPHDRAALATKLAPVSYDPDARCPTWLAFLDVIMAGNRDLIDFLQRAVGYSLTGDVSEQVLFFAHGTGANGKSTFTETLAALLGDYAQKAPRGLLTMKPGQNEGIPNDVARLPGARFVVSNEVEEGRRLAEAQVKDLTGGDKLTARFLHGEFFEFLPTHKLWIYGNHRPVVRGTDEGIWRRIRLIPFDVTLPTERQDKRLPAKLRAELPGILTWAVQGCLAWQHGGLGTPAEVRAATDAYRSEMDVVAAFLQENCIPASNASTTKNAMYGAYQKWAEESGERALSKIAFGRRLKERGIEEGTVGRLKDRAWMGWGLVTNLEEGEL